MKTIILARHAKSDWNASHSTDFERPLNKRGENDAPFMAAYLQKCGYLLDQIISSDAKRALQTANEYYAMLQPAHGLITHHDLYLASLNTLTDIISSLPQNSSHLMLVGHNPGMTEALNFYTAEFIDNMPTCSVAVIQFDVMNWKDISEGEGDLLGFEFPKRVRSMK